MSTESINQYLLDVKFENYHLVSEYIFVIDSLIERIRLIKGLDDKNVEELRKQTFFRGLSKNLRVMFAMSGQDDVNIVMRNIKKAEHPIINTAVKETKTPDKDNSLITKPNRFTKQKPETNQKASKDNKYCSVHKVKSHNDSECYVQIKRQSDSKQTNGKNSDNLDKNDKKSLNNIEKSADLIIFDGVIGDSLQAKILLDSGSSNSFISMTAAKNSRLKMIESIPTNLTLADKSTTTTTSKCKVNISVQGKLDPITVELLILPELNFDIILGTKFLCESKINLDFHTNDIRVQSNKLEKTDQFLIKSILDIFPSNTATLNKLIEKYKEDTKNPGPIKNVKFEIPLDVERVKTQTAYSVPIHARDKFKQHLDEIIANDIVRESDSLYASPCFTVPKPVDSSRLLIDFREPNKLSSTFEYYFPTIKDAFVKLKGNKIFSKIDLQKGFYQIEIAEKNKHKTALTTPFGKYEFNRLPFGLKNAPKFFNNVISKILKDFDNVIVFIDDILVASQNETEHLEVLEKIFKILAENNVIINFSKSEFLTSEVKYLGYFIDKDTYRPDLTRIENFAEWNRPTTRKQLRRLIGKMTWYTEFIPNLASKIAHLNDYLKGKNSKIQLLDQDMAIVSEIYNKLVKIARNFLPNPNEAFEIHVDESDRGSGAVSTQNRNPISYYSKKFNETESRYTTTEKGAYAAFLAIYKWNGIIGGSKITIFTDSKNNLGEKSIIANVQTVGNSYCQNMTLTIVLSKDVKILLLMNCHVSMIIQIVILTSYKLLL